MIDVSKYNVVWLQSVKSIDKCVLKAGCVHIFLLQAHNYRRGYNRYLLLDRTYCWYNQETWFLHSEAILTCFMRWGTIASCSAAWRCDRRLSRSSCVWSEYTREGNTSDAIWNIMRSSISAKCGLGGTASPHSAWLSLSSYWQILNLLLQRVG